MESGGPARAFGSCGDRVGLLARGQSGLDGAARDVRSAGGTPLTVPTDMADPDQVEAAADRVESELGPIDVWVNVAFTSVFAPFEQVSAAEFRRVTEVTYLGYVYGTMSALNRMVPRDHGTVVQVGSALAYRGIPLQSAVNTPQFSWVLSRLPRQAKPVPPIYQPEVAARAVLYAGDHPGRREYWVGASTVGTLLANAVVPGLLDRYLGRTAYDSQQTADVRDPDQPVNLWDPADGADGRDYGAHGIFDDRSTSRSPQLWASQHHGLLGGIAGTAGALVGAAAAVRGRR